MSDNISTLIGILLDVSGSMSRNISARGHKKRGAWVRSIFKVIDDLIKYDVSPSNYVFSVGFGASCGNEIFDLLGTLEQYQSGSYDDIVERSLQILENGGARTVRKWASKSVIKNSVSHGMAAMILKALESDRNFVRLFVHDCLPPACRDFGNVLGDFVYGMCASAASMVVAATEEDIKKVVTKAKKLLAKGTTKSFLLKEVNFTSSIFKVKDASKIIHGCVDEEELTEPRIQELMDTVEPFIYGETPLFRSLEKALELFSGHRYQSHKKLLFILSDGQPSDGVNAELFEQFRNKGVTVVSCFITKSSRVDPLRLYSSASEYWEYGARLLCDLSSTIPTQSLPRTILVKRGWKIDIQNETKLFLHVNHPDNVSDACDLARNVVCCQDTLADVLASVSLDIYVNQSLRDLLAQEGENCYANASATVLHLSMNRILGREGGYPDFGELRQQFIQRLRENEASKKNAQDVLQNICRQYRLRCKKVDLNGALEAVTEKRPVLARFHLTSSEWREFNDFYKQNPTGILTEKKINIFQRWRSQETHPHAVVLTSFNNQCLRLMSSWGTRWGDMGFFRVKTADVIGLEFTDVFWEEDDLTENEKAYFKKHGAETAVKLINKFIALQTAEYKCPKCDQTSLVTEFTGHMSQTKCPKCEKKFCCGESGNMALNMYLTSLSR